MSKPIPIEAAQQLAEQYGLSQILVVGWQRQPAVTHITTFGVTADDKVRAAEAGDLLGKHLALYDVNRTVHADFRRDFDAGLFKESLDLLKLIRNRQGCTGPMLQQAERILNAAGQGVRSGG